ncbi:sigma-70 family RNA polymerase sigma factor [Antarcticibacterium sp. 1MA-6-2]|uniref:RNA polymerase sigma factor n=1 Tax=Antarcticibacterium sp. 1MA-6-2 TaxID=2908210 RepID=UPI001F46343B|nr:sigma-70 family RNA polymerase sigma factor [Antarcticibacterium sp. 1MA-6-2]UJH89843.1 sigma-70 family RNA polymerase sigma factor [Antarcticibacterium sp. 1MA-6-2]
MSGDRMLSEDLTQEVFYKVLKYRNSYNDGKFISWMFTIARNSLATHFRRNQDHVLLKISHYENLPEEEDGEKEDYSQLQKALDLLNPEDKELLVLHKLQNISHQEIAEIVGSTPGAVKTKTSRALKKLKEIYFKTVGNEA